MFSPRMARLQSSLKFAHTSIPTGEIFVGDILYTSGGWEATYNYFYKVVELKGTATLVLQRLQKEIVEHHSYDSGEERPLVNKKTSDAPVIARIGKTGYAKLDGELLYKWDGKPRYFHSY